MNSEFYMSLKIEGIEINALELEKILYSALKKHLSRDFDFPLEDIIIAPIEYYEIKNRDDKK